MKCSFAHGAVIATMLLSLLAQAQPAIFKGADLKLGEQLIVEHQCAACHTRRVGGDGSDIYNPQGRINTPAFCAAWWSSAIPNSIWACFLKM